MKLQELATLKTVKNVSRVMESHFDAQMDFDRLSGPQARRMLTKVRRLVSEHRQSTSRHWAEKNPNYLKLVMMEQALSAKIAEEDDLAASLAKSAALDTVAKQKDPKLKMALTKAAKGQPLSPDEQKMVSGVALMKTEGTLKRAFKIIKESEVQQAQVVLAAQDMVDNIQAMIEDATEMQFKELPALVDSIRNQIGMDQAVQFQQDATAALSGLVQNLQGTKTSLEQGLGVVTGQQMAPGIDAAVNGDELGADELPPPGGEEEVDLSLDANLEEPEAEPGGGAALGRERR